MDPVKSNFSYLRIQRQFLSVMAGLAVTVSLLFGHASIAQVGKTKVAATPAATGTSGFPKMTEQERDAIVKPQEGMVIYNLTAHKPQYYNGTEWKFFDMSHHNIGEAFAGGIIFYIDPSGDHGLVCAESDQRTSVGWGFFDKEVGAHGKLVGTGKFNTEKVADACREKLKDKDLAARVCDELQLSGYDDWFLPSIEELKLMYKNLKAKGLGNFAYDEYWTSSETDFNNAWVVNFGTGQPTEMNVTKTLHVRAIRAF